MFFARNYDVRERADTRVDAVCPDAPLHHGSYDGVGRLDSCLGRRRQLEDCPMRSYRSYFKPTQRAVENNRVQWLVHPCCRRSFDACLELSASVENDDTALKLRRKRHFLSCDPCLLIMC